MRDASICGLGQTASSAIESAIRRLHVFQGRARDRAPRAEADGGARGRRAGKSASSRARRSSTRARALGIETPTLCYGETLQPANACRVCVVEVEGSRVLASGLRAEGGGGDEGQHRHGARASSRGSSCSSCSPRRSTSRPRRSPRGTSARYGAEPERFGPPAPPSDDRDLARTGHHVEPDGRTAATVHQPVKVDNELYVRDYGKCILCYKCVDACGEQYQNTFAIHVAGRGFDARISTELATPLPESACVYCGNCIAVCPTGALMFRSEHELREAGEWREDEQTVTETICPYCGVGCSLELHVQDNGIVKVTSRDDHDVTRGNLCIKGRFGFGHVQARRDGRSRLGSTPSDLRPRRSRPAIGRHPRPRVRPQPSVGRDPRDPVRADPDAGPRSAWRPRAPAGAARARRRATCRSATRARARSSTSSVSRSCAPPRGGAQRGRREPRPGGELSTRRGSR